MQWSSNRTHRCSDYATERCAGDVHISRRHRYGCGWTHNDVARDHLRVGRESTGKDVLSANGPIAARECDYERARAGHATYRGCVLSEIQRQIPVSKPQVHFTGVTDPIERRLNID